MQELPKVVRAHYADEFRLHLRFDDGLSASVDFAPWLEGPIFEPLRSVEYFRRFLVDGGTVCWPNGADIAPETLYETAKSTKAA